MSQKACGSQKHNGSMVTSRVRHTIGTTAGMVAMFAMHQCHNVRTCTHFHTSQQYCQQYQSLTATRPTIISSLKTATIIHSAHICGRTCTCAQWGRGARVHCERQVRGYERRQHRHGCTTPVNICQHTYTPCPSTPARQHASARNNALTWPSGHAARHRCLHTCDVSCLEPVRQR
jgi:hypothetical protein